MDSCSANEAGRRVGSEPKSIALREDSDIVGIAGVTCIKKCLGNARASIRMSQNVYPLEVCKVEDAAVVLIIFWCRCGLCNTEMSDEVVIGGRLEPRAEEGVVR